MPTMSNNFGADRALTATASAPAAGPAPFGGLDAGLLSKLVAAKMAKQAPAPAQAQPAYAAPQQQMFAPPPQLGTQQMAPGGGKPPQKVTRMRMLDSNQDQMQSPGFSPIKTQRSQVQEYQLPDGSWSLDAVYGTVGGNEAAARMGYQAELDRRNGNVGGGGGRNLPGPDDRARSGIPFDPKNRNNDARGQGYGMDFGKKGTDTEGRG